MARISLSQLAKYLTASSIARRSIVTASKYPKDGFQKSYVPVDQRLLAHLVDGAEVRETGLHSDYLLEAVAAFHALSWPPLDGRSFRRPDPKQGKVTVAGVEVSLYPTALMSRNGGKGACKLYYTKSLPLNGKTGAAMAALLYYYGSVHLGDEDYDSDLCEVVEVRTGASYTATGSYKQLLKQVEAACEEIALRWDAA